jgi:anti-anti-sigma factor
MMFEIRERQEADGTVCLMLAGELDLSVRDYFRARLHALKAANQAVRIDLSELEFIDSSGVSTLLRALNEARDGWTLEVDRDTSAEVEYVIQLTGVASRIWPTEPDQLSRGRRRNA